MRARIARWARLGGLALVLTAGGTTSAAALSTTQSPSSRRAVAPPEVAPAPDDDVTERDVVASNEKVRQAYGALIAMWTADFGELGARFAAPGLVRYRGAARSACGVLSSDNALYCPRRNTIYFDEVFVARQAKSAALQLGTDGDMAAVGIIAHEMGHAVAMQLGEDSRIPYRNEATADCLAGAFTQRSSRDGLLEPGDLDEAFFGLAAAGDPIPEPAGDARLDARIARRRAVMGHVTREQRLASFRAGYEGGAGACLVAFRG